MLEKAVLQPIACATPDGMIDPDPVFFQAFLSSVTRPHPVKLTKLTRCTGEGINIVRLIDR